jgi:hypothetical protein
MSNDNFTKDPITYVITAISPVFAAIAIYSLFMPWVSGKLLVIGKTIRAFDFPNVFWSVLIGCAALVVVYIRAILAREIIKRRGVIIALSAATLIAAGYFLYGYSKTPSIPGVRVSFHGGLLICFGSLILSVVGAIIPLDLFNVKKDKCLSENSEKSKRGQPEIHPEQ